MSSNGGSGSRSFTENGSYTFQFQDAAGNTGSTKAAATWMDKTALWATVEYSVQTPTRGEVADTLKPNKGEKVMMTNNGGSLTYTFTDNGSFIFEFQDMAGNTGNTEAVVNRIDKTPPTATAEYSTTEAAKEPVKPRVQFSEAVELQRGGEGMQNQGGNVYTLLFTENRSREMEYADLAGNRGKALALAVTSIGKGEKPGTDDPTPPGPPSPPAPPTPSKLFKPEPKPEHTEEIPADIQGHWAQESITWVYENGLMTGYPDGLFHPEESLTREELWTVLCRFLDLESGGEKIFPELPLWCAGYVEALTQQGIVNGVGRGWFESDRPITREEMAVILNRAMMPGRAIPVDRFLDDKEISPWARQSVYNIRAKGWMVGSGNRFAPKTLVTRGEIAAIFDRFLRKRKEE